MPPREPPDIWVTLIGIGKLVKMTALLAFGVTALLLVHHDVVEVLRHWFFVLGIAPGGHLVRELLAGAEELDDRRLREIGVAMFVYAALFGVEGTGLLLRRRWGEWVTIVITGSFIPLEVYETVSHPHLGRATFLAINVTAVAYLLHRVRAKPPRIADGRTKANGPTGSPGGAA